MKTRAEAVMDQVSGDAGTWAVFYAADGLEDADAPDLVFCGDQATAKWFAAKLNAAPTDEEANAIVDEESNTATVDGGGMPDA